MFTAIRNNEARKFNTIEEARLFYHKMADRSQLWTVRDVIGNIVIQ